MTDDNVESDVTALLLNWRQGNHSALERLVPIVYEELRRVARARLRDERAGHVLQTTALVNEAYLRLLDLNRMSFENRTHFFAMAARLMRQILVDHARRQLTLKRGGDIAQVGVNEEPVAPGGVSVDVLALNQALEQLASFDARLAHVVELRYFSGLNIDDTATALGLSHATVERDWALARAWLYQRLA